MLPLFVVNSLSLALLERTNELAIIIGENAKSQSYCLTNVRKASLQLFKITDSYINNECIHSFWSPPFPLHKLLLLICIVQIQHICLLGVYFNFKPKNRRLTGYTILDTRYLHFKKKKKKTRGKWKLAIKWNPRKVFPILSYPRVSIKGKLTVVTAEFPDTSILT